jgi:hypothetical protein
MTLKKKLETRLPNLCKKEKLFLNRWIKGVGGRVHQNLIKNRNAN